MYSVDRENTFTILAVCNGGELWVFFCVVLKSAERLIAVTTSPKKSWKKSWLQLVQSMILNGGFFLYKTQKLLPSLDELSFDDSVIYRTVDSSECVFLSFRSGCFFLLIWTAMYVACVYHTDCL